jgi:dihydropyrimidine dehydrogenase (NAD+) subunit PreA
MTREVEAAGADMIECNLGCPHGMPEIGMGAACGQNPDVTRQITRWVKEVAKTPVIVKLTPNVTDIRSIAAAARDGGADAIAAINTVAGIIGVDLERIEPLPSVGGRSTYGGISGPGMKPIALRNVCEIFRETGLPVSGMGGINTWQDAAEFILLGAATLQVCTAVMHLGYRKVIDGLRAGLIEYMGKHGFGSIPEMVGLAARKITSFEDLDLTSSFRLQALIDRSACTGCRVCQTACTDAGHQAIEWDERERKARVNGAKCGACGLCLDVCPVKCIRLIDRSPA